MCRHYFFNEVVKINEQGNKALPSVGQYGKGCGQYIPTPTSHSVNKSITKDA